MIMNVMNNLSSSQGGGVAGYSIGNIGQDPTDMPIYYNEGYNNDWRWGIVSVSANIQSPFYMNTFIIGRGANLNYQLITENGNFCTVYINNESQLSLNMSADYELFAIMIFFN